MGRWYWDKKRMVEDCKSVSMSFLRKNGFLQGFRSGRVVWKNRMGEETASMDVAVSTLHGDSYMRLWYTMTDRNTGQETDLDYRVQLVTTPCHFGGVRWWFICPLSPNGVYCGRRVGVLYRAPRADYYGCRHCYDLSYESRNESQSSPLGRMGYLFTLGRRREKFLDGMARWTYRGKPTRKARRLHALETQISNYSRRCLADLP
jgi:hypothetical protein